MSAFRIGAGDRQPFRTEADGQKSLPQQLLAAVGALVKWLPGEVVAGYAATVVMMQPDQPETGPAKPPDVSWAPWIVALVATPVFVLLGALYANNMKKLVARIILSLPAFVLWSASVPHSAWDNVDGFKNNHAVFLFVLLLVTSAFTTIAELVTRE
jgi:hypothetical protein